jgi:hypothetical protein
VRFSERYGYRKVREIVQLDSVSDQLKNALWSLLKIHVWNHVHYTSAMLRVPVKLSALAPVKFSRAGSHWDCDRGKGERGTTKE